MSAASVIPFPASRPASTLGREAPRVLMAFRAELARCPPRPPGLAACVAYLQEPFAQLPARQMAVRALQSLRTGLFAAPGRDAEMGLFWREALATACYARVIAQQSRSDASLLAGAGLLHRAGEIAALRALAVAEKKSDQRIAGSVIHEVLAASDDELFSRVTRSWALPGQLRLTLINWREQQDSLARPEGVSLLMMAQALATELVHAATCPPGLAEAACESLRLAPALVERSRAESPAIQALIAAV
jgi:hypothetical protein